MTTSKNWYFGLFQDTSCRDSSIQLIMKAWSGREMEVGEVKDSWNRRKGLNPEAMLNNICLERGNTHVSLSPVILKNFKWLDSLWSICVNIQIIFTHPFAEKPLICSSSSSLNWCPPFRTLHRRGTSSEAATKIPHRCVWSCQSALASFPTAPQRDLLSPL